MRQYLNIFVRQVLRCLCHVFFLLPIRQDMIFFESYQGRNYSCNPKYICEYINRTHPGSYKLVWSLVHPEEYKDIPYIIPVKYLSLKFMYYRFRSRVIICNKTDEVFLPKRNGQTVLNTWHAGGAYKKVGISYDKYTGREVDWQNDIVRKETSYYLSSSEYFTRYDIRDAYKYTGEVLNYGMPRNDGFFDAAFVKRCREKIDNLYSTQGTFIVLYAPTYRSANATQGSVRLECQALAKAVEKRFHKKTVFLVRAHYYEPTKQITQDHERIDVSMYDDMQELLAAADMLITDYSSSIWDYALLKRPCLLYVPDVDEYLQDRGFYTDIETWPGLVARTQGEMARLIEELDPEACARRAEDHLKRFGSYETGHAAEAVFRKVIEGEKS